MQNVNRGEKHPETDYKNVGLLVTKFGGKTWYSNAYLTATAAGYPCLMACASMFIDPNNATNCVADNGMGTFYQHLDGPFS